MFTHNRRDTMRKHIAALATALAVGLVIAGPAQATEKRGSVVGSKIGSSKANLSSSSHDAYAAHYNYARMVAALHCGYQIGNPGTCVESGVDYGWLTPGWGGILAEFRIRWRNNLNGNTRTCRRWIVTIDGSPADGSIDTWETTTRTDGGIPPRGIYCTNIG